MHLGIVIGEHSRKAIQFWFDIENENSFILNYLDAIKNITTKTLKIYNPNLLHNCLLYHYLKNDYNRHYNPLTEEILSSSQNIILTRDRIVLLIFSESTFKNIIELFSKYLNNFTNTSINQTFSEFLNIINIHKNLVPQTYNKMINNLNNSEFLERINKNFSYLSIEINLDDFLQIKTDSEKNKKNLLKNIYNLFYENDIFYLKVLYNLLLKGDNSINMFSQNNTINESKLKNYNKSYELMKIIEFSNVGNCINLWCQSNKYDLPILKKHGFIGYSHKLKKTQLILDESFISILKLFDITFPIKFEEPHLELIYQNAFHENLNSSKNNYDN